MNIVIDPLKIRQLTKSLLNKDPELAFELADLRKKNKGNEEAREIASVIKASGIRTNFEGLATELALETIVLRTGRPVLTIVNGDTELVFPDAESEVWRNRLLTARPLLQQSIPAVGRVELENASISWVGTGWMIADGIMVTNRHVAEVFGRRNGDRFVFREGLNGGTVIANLDVLEEYGRNEERVYHLEEILHIEPEPGPDMAFLKVVPTQRSGNLPNHIMPSKGGKQLVNRHIAVIGYPARDSRIPDQNLMEKIFGDVYNKKRLAPGQVTAIDANRLYHDCSTLGGCSGGVVLDLETGEAIGLHFAGLFLESNYAVPISYVARKLDELGNIRNSKLGKSSSTLLQQSKQSSAILVDINNGSGKLTIPLEMQISIDHTALQQQLQLQTMANSLESEDDFIDEGEINEARKEDYSDREGYVEDFLGDGFIVPLPEVVGERWKDDVLKYTNKEKEDHVLRYRHFSVVMCRSRRLCFFSAVNINGRRSKKADRVGWRTDPRIPKEAQIIRECYGDPPKFSRGHMTRREDPVWGREIEALQGNADSMVVTNAVPQMQAFNAPIWLALEDYALNNARADKMNISVFTGPIFRSSDKVEHGVKIPVLFWKVIAFIHDETGKLSATGYIISQKGQLPEFEFIFGQFSNSQVPISLIEQKTGLSFGKLKESDPLNTGEEALIVPLLDESHIRFLK